MMNRFIGGEFWYEQNILTDCSSESFNIFLGGGQSSLYVICEYLKSVGINKVLLPAYLCPTILDRFDKQKMSYDFYEINDDFSINVSSLLQKIDGFKTLMFINYFGMSLTEKERCFLNELRKSGIILIEDKVHTIDDCYIGDFAFNSYRKFVPYSGSLLYSKYDISKIISQMPINISYFEMIREAREKKTKYVISGMGNEEEYLPAFHKSEEKYYTDVSLGDHLEQEMIGKLDIKKIGKLRRANYEYLLEKIADIYVLKPIFKDYLNKIPLGLPVLIESDKRDFIRHRLREKNIFLPIHWDLRDEVRIHSKKAKDISQRILTLVIDQRYSIDDMDYMINEIEKIVIR